VTSEQSVSIDDGLFRRLVEHSLVGVYLIQDDRLVYANRRLAQIFGYSREEMLQLPSVLNVIAESHRPLVAEKLRQRMTGELESIEYCVKGVRRDGQVIDLDVRSVRTEHAGRPAVMGSMIDITEQRRLETALRALSVTDELTGLYNRRGFLVLAQSHLALAQRHKRNVALIFADVDELKRINDEHGHAAGDRALIAAARILRLTYRSADVVARLAGDEFAVFPLEVSDQTTIPRLVSRLEQHLASHNAQSGEPFTLSMSLGVGHYRPDECRTVEELLAAADQGLYHTKRGRKA
jgi:diguanylate cyclase (GGDEF)-like protein/PAS domain S-box-containing protein